MRMPCLLSLPLAIALPLSACSSQQLYSTGQEWQKNECNKLVDAEQRTRCMNNAKISHDEYKRDAEAARAGSGASQGK